MSEQNVWSDTKETKSQKSNNVRFNLWTIRNGISLIGFKFTQKSIAIESGKNSAKKILLKTSTRNLHPAQNSGPIPTKTQNST